MVVVVVVVVVVVAAATAVVVVEEVVVVHKGFLDIWGLEVSRESLLDITSRPVSIYKAAQGHLLSYEAA